MQAVFYKTKFICIYITVSCSVKVSISVNHSSTFMFPLPCRNCIYSKLSFQGWLDEDFRAEAIVFLFIEQTQILLVILFRDFKIVTVDKIVPGIVRGIDIDHLHLVQVGVLQEL